MSKPARGIGGRRGHQHRPRAAVGADLPADPALEDDPALGAKNVVSGSKTPLDMRGVVYINSLH